MSRASRKRRKFKLESEPVRKASPKVDPLPAIDQARLLPHLRHRQVY